MDWRQMGGAAFPVVPTADQVDLSPETGMSLRDWLAGQALMGMLAFPGLTPAATSHEVMPEAFSQRAYQYADAMLAARARS